jgi:hypothetical protein
MAAMRSASSSMWAWAMRLTLAAGAGLVVPQAHQLGDLGHRKAQLARAPMKRSVHVGLGYWR